MAIKLIVGLCNPGSAYRDTRHNAGQWCVEAINHCYQGNFKLDKRYNALVAQGPGGITLMIPQTFMNDSGVAVGAYARFYKIAPEEILVVHDDLDLPPGTVKLKAKGGHGGHNGLRDIFRALSSRDFFRLRLGIGHPGHKSLVHSYVLNKPSSNDKIDILRAIDRSVSIMPTLLEGQVEQAMLTLHS